MFQYIFSTFFFSLSLSFFSYHGCLVSLRDQFKFFMHVSIGDHVQFLIGMQVEVLFKSFSFVLQIYLLAGTGKRM